MQHGGGPDETRRFEGPGGPGGSDEHDATRRLGGPEPTRRMDDAGVADGTVLDDRYRLEGLLGAGGMADVHRATDLRLNRPVAVKIFRPSTDSDGEQRFTREARLLANLSHPGLVAVHDFGVERHSAYLVMELVDGRTLREVLDQRRRLPRSEVARIGADLAGVLGYVHDQGVVHRDVTPSNVLLGRDGRVQLADFGISRLVDTSGLTGGDTTLGTAAYLAPEQVRGEWVGPPADVYALGLVLLEGVTGYVEYSGGGWDAANERLSRAPGVPDDLPGPLRRALLAMTEFDPSGRPTAAQAGEMLAAAGAGAEARGVAPEPPRRSRAARNVAIALGLVAVVAVLAAVLFGGADDEPGVAQPGVTPTATDDPGEGSGGGDPAAETPGGDPTGEDPGGDPAGEDPGGDSGGDPTGGDPTGEDPGGDGSGFPDLPSFDVPDMPEAPELPDTPQVPDSAKSAWQRFTDWLSGLF